MDCALRLCEVAEERCLMSIRPIITVFFSSIIDEEFNRQRMIVAFIDTKSWSIAIALHN